MRRVRSQFRQLVSCLSFVTAFAVLAVLVAPAVGEAATSGARANLLAFGNTSGALGGQVAFGTGVAVNRAGMGGASAGDVYVPNFNNRRVEVFSALGAFVRAFGIDVVASGQHEAGAGYEICEAVSSPADVCKAGTASSAVAGAITGVEAIAIDQATGNVFVASNANRRIDVFSATGTFQGAFGRDVIPGGVTTDLEFCTTTCQAGVNAATSGAFATGGLLKAALTVAPDGHVYVGDRVNHRINEFAPTLNGSNQIVGVAFTRAIGWGVNNGTAALQTCTTTCQAGVTTGGAGDGQFPANTPSSVAVDSSGAIYAVTSGDPAPAGTPCSAATNPCRIQKFNADGTFNGNFGPSTGGSDGCQTTWTSGAATAVAPNGIAIDPTSQHVFITMKTTATTYQLCEFDATGVLIDRSPTTAITSSTTGYLAVAFGVLNRIYVNTPITGGLGATYLLGPPPPPPGLTIDPVDAGTITTTTVTFEGTVTVPVAAVPAETKYHFEYSTDGVNWISTPTTDISVGSTPGEYDVTLNVTGLAPNTVYLARLVGKTPTSANTPPVVFKTDAQAPGLGLIYPDQVSQTKATLNAQINPRNAGATYYFEWGTTTAYGDRVPATARQLGGGSELLLAQETLTGLDPATNYHFRVVAENATGTITSDDQPFETLNECGFINGRCMELVSPADKGLVGSAGESSGNGIELQNEVASGGDSIAYTMGFGTSDSTSGGNIAYQSKRAPTLWVSDQISPPMSAPPDWDGGDSIPSTTLGFSESQSCAILWSRQPLAEHGRSGHPDLYRRGSDGSYTLITYLPPIDGLDSPYRLFGISDDCKTVLFTTANRYPGISGTGSPRLYLWDETTGLHNAGIVPGPSSLVDAGASPGAGGGEGSGGSARNVLSDDGSTVFFTATRQRDGGVAGAAENGKKALFARRRAIGDVYETIDVSESKNPLVPDLGATYQTASKDGEHVFFLANYGLAGPAGPGPTTCNASTGEGCALYRYDLATEDLVNVSVDGNGMDTSGPGVVGVLDASPDGSRVYFAARGQLVEGEGKTFEQNGSNGTYNVYAAYQEFGGPTAPLKFVGVVRNQDLDENAGVLIRTVWPAPTNRWVSRTTPDGEYLVFGSSTNVTGYESQGRVELYRFAYQSGTTVCVSCRRDGGVPTPNPYSPAEFRVPSAKFSLSHLHPPSPLAADGRVFFLSADRLAPGASEGNNNLYEWEEGQVSVLVDTIPNVSTGVNADLQFAGVSWSGDDVYFISRRSLVAQDVDGRSDVYDARSGGGFAPPPEGPVPCNPLVEGSCGGSDGSSSLVPSVESDRPGSGDLSPPSRSVFSVEGLSMAQRARLLAGRRAALVVRVDRPGTVSVKGTARIGGFGVSVLSASRQATRAGRVRIPIGLSKAARRHVSRTGSLRVALTVRFSETSKTAVRTLGLRQAKPNTKRRSHTRRVATDRRAGS